MCRHEAEDGPGRHLVVFSSADLGQPARDGCGDVERRGADKDLDEPFALQNLIAARGKPLADHDRNVRTGSQVGQYHCLQTHGEPRLFARNLS